MEIRFINELFNKWVLFIILAFLAPLMEAQGMIFSRIHVTNSQGPAPLPFGAMDAQGSNVKSMK